ncbi:UvrD-helicase domain-containing protein [Alkalihalobacillus sp. AL-G]|uniref:HelD family protein n=1 Tax=Alkalihalobacillus sp. AL-G TaxID=2926399 RepID=UPI00272BD21E|nr:UvrD-helicase domain-containing protein [Alkalihalobacillus sp. AL-G]WLD95334.1 UvrD-helicase domain-containing protein [Alkalihalobacillus sp. AL-G]
MQSAFATEKQQLEKIAAEIDHQMERLEKIPRYFGDDITEQVLDDRREQHRKNLIIASQEAFFGRLDFKADEKDKPEEIYIGKVGVSKESTTEILVVDWRAPVASMFYTFTGGEDEAFYNSPEGKVEGDIYLKRNVVIRNRELQRVVDTYVKGSDEAGGTDEFLLYRLGDKKDNRLRDIVSTIQAEQNHIIRAEKNKPLIIQGVAGSGKTTVALHRLAYLLYHYRDYLTANQMIIFAPNKMFLDYISNVLPELGVGGIQQTTFNDWAIEVLDESIKVLTDATDLEVRFAPTSDELEKDELQSGRLKGSLKYKEIIEATLVDFENTMVPIDDFEIWDGCSIRASAILNWANENRSFPISSRRNRVVKRLKSWIEQQVEAIMPHERKERKKQANNQLRSYLKSWPDYTAFSFYQDLFKKSNRDKFAELLNDYLPEKMIDHTRRNLSKKIVSAEDLPAILSIHAKLFGIDKSFTYQHIVIDEAQDFSPFQIEVLKSYAKENSFTILGDISQGIHSYKGIEQWQEMMDVFDDKPPAYVQLKQSYRSTLEIIEYANCILLNMKHTGGLAKPVFRSGKPVKEMNLDKKNRAATIVSILKEIERSDVNSVAIVGRTSQGCEGLYQELKDLGVEATLITAEQNDYRGGISIIPVYLTKGLEFDAVIMSDVDSTNYRFNEQDAKLLYVGCTRALHQLWILYAGDPTPLLKTK